MLKTKRIYDAPETSDGARVLVMRLWPRGIRRGQIDEWNRDVAPSRDLLFAFKHEGLPWKDYVSRYWKEISPEALDALRRRARRETITLLCACVDEDHCHRGLLKRAVAGRKRRNGGQSHPLRKATSPDRVSLSRRRALSGSRARGARSPARRGGRLAARS